MVGCGAVASVSPSPSPAAETPSAAPAAVSGTPAASAIPPTAPAPAYGVLVDLLTAPSIYYANLVGVDGRVWASIKLEKRTPISNQAGHAIELPYVSASSTALYMLAGDWTVWSLRLPVATIRTRRSVITSSTLSPRTASTSWAGAPSAALWARPEADASRAGRSTGRATCPRRGARATGARPAQRRRCRPTAVGSRRPRRTPWTGCSSGRLTEGSSPGSTALEPVTGSGGSTTNTSSLAAI